MTSITFWRSVCGCAVGAWSALLTIGYCIMAPPLASAPLWARVTAGAGIVLAAALAGKLLALATARAFIFALER